MIDETSSTDRDTWGRGGSKILDSSQFPSFSRDYNIFPTAQRSAGCHNRDLHLSG